jgi:type VI secretion system protein ImpH
MAAESGTQDLDVSRSLLGKCLRAKPGSFDFFQAVRLVHRLQSGREMVGGFAQPVREALRFSVNNSLAFPAAQVADLDWADDGRARMNVNFMGLTGPMGLLPHSYTELIQERNRAKDHALQDFLDVFNHRSISLFYQAWEKYRFYVTYERGQLDRFSHCIMSLVGLGTPGLEHRQRLSDMSLLYYSGLLSLQPKPALGLEQIIGDHFDVPVEIQQFVGAWHKLDPADQCGLEDDAYSDQIGQGAVAGDEVWDLQSRCRIKLGPLTARQYASFLPAGDAWEPLRALTSFYAGGEIEFELQLVLRSAEVPPCVLQGDGDGVQQLGWFSWIKSGATFARDPGDTLLLLS